MGNAVAGAVATLLGLWLPVNPLTMALGAILALGILVRLRLSEAAGLAVVVVLFVMDRPEHDFLRYTLARMGTIVVGMTVGFLVNRLIRPPDASDGRAPNWRKGTETWTEASTGCSSASAIRRTTPASRWGTTRTQPASTSRSPAPCLTWARRRAGRIRQRCSGRPTAR